MRVVISFRIQFNPQIVYGGSTGGELYRFDTKTGQFRMFLQRPLDRNKGLHRYPGPRQLLSLFQPPHPLYQASQFLMKTADGGKSWKNISPDLTLLPVKRKRQRKVLSITIAPSPVAAGTIGWDRQWPGSITRNDGQTWSEVSPRGLPTWSMIS